MKRGSLAFEHVALELPRSWMFFGGKVENEEHVQ